MLGLDSVGVFLAYAGSVLSSLACVIYGVMNWNRPAVDEAGEAREELRWEKEESKIDEKL